MDSSDLQIHPSSTEPIFRQIANQLRRMLATGALKDDELLPSVRDVAAYHAINPMTVSRAYSLLEAEGVLQRVRGKGMAAARAHQKPRSEAERMQLLESSLQEVARKARELELPSNLVSLHLRRLMEKQK